MKDGFFVVIPLFGLGALLVMSVFDSPVPSAPAHSPCLNPAAVQTALDACVSARLKLTPPMTAGFASTIFERCQDWAVDVACVRASIQSIDGGTP